MSKDLQFNEIFVECRMAKHFQNSIKNMNFQYIFFLNNYQMLGFNADSIIKLMMFLAVGPHRGGS